MRAAQTFATVSAITALLLAACGEKRGLPPRADGERGDQSAVAERPTLGAAPDFALEAMDGSTVRLSDMAGQVVVLNFWATWCAPCREEIPAFVELQRRLGSSGLRFVGLSLDEDGFDVVRPFAAEFGINYPLVINDGRVAEAYGGHFVVPTTFVVDRELQIRHRFIGIVQLDVLASKLEELLSEERTPS